VKAHKALRVGSCRSQPASTREIVMDANVIEELRKADRIITAMFGVMTLGQIVRVSAKLEADGTSPDGMTRYHERRAVLAAVGVL
jgi:hypothetical protein